MRRDVAPPWPRAADDETGTPMADNPETDMRVEAAYASIQQAQTHLATVRGLKRHREAGRAFSLVATKLDEARLWLDEALAIADEPEAADGDRP